MQIRSLDPQSAELMSINLSGGINTLLPGTDPLPPRNLRFCRNTWLQQSEPIREKLSRKTATYLFGYGIFHHNLESTSDQCKGVPSFPPRLLRTLRIPTLLHWEMTV